MESFSSPIAVFIDDEEIEPNTEPAPSPAKAVEEPDEVKLSQFVAPTPPAEQSQELQRNSVSPANTDVPKKETRFLVPVQMYNRKNSTALSIRQGNIKNSTIPTIVFQICTNHTGKHDDWKNHGVVFSLSAAEFISLAQLVLASGDNVDFQYHNGKCLKISRTPETRGLLISFQQQQINITFTMPSNIYTLLKGLITELYFGFCQYMYPTIPAACYFKLL